MSTIEFITGDSREALKALPAGSVHCCITSPPYFGLRDYGVEGQIGLEPSLEQYINELMLVFAEVKRVLREDGTLWLNLGDSYTSGGRATRDRDDKLPARGMGFRAGTPVGLKPKDLIGMPWRVAFALQADGWYLRSDIIWAKPNAMPESVTDRPTRAHEYLFMFAKQERYWYDTDAVREPHVRLWNETNGGSWAHASRTDEHALAKGKAAVHRGKGYPLPNPLGRNRRTVWNIATRPFPAAHFATFPPALVEPCLLAGCPEGGTVLDPFAGAGTVGLVAQQHNRNAILVELNPEYVALAKRRLEDARCAA